MQRIKKPFVWLMLIALVITLVPVGLAKPVHAATNIFMLDDRELQATSSLTTEFGDNQIKRENVLVTTNSTLTITGTYTTVNEESLRARVEQLTSTKNASGQIEWVTDSTHFKDGSITKDTSSTVQRFKATNLSLFPGFNKITLSGSQNGITRSDVFYVLYDQVPYVQELKMLGSSSGEIYLNEGIKVVSDRENISIQGEVKNATDVTVAINNENPLMSTLTQTGKFFSPSLKLKTGLNTLTIVVKTGADSVTLKREVYYFDKSSPFIKIMMTHDGKDYDLFQKTPTVTGAVTTSPTGLLEVEVLLPDTGKSFTEAGVVHIDSTPVLASDISIVSDVAIPAPDGVSAAYRLVTFKINSFAFKEDPNNASVLLENQVASLTVAYDNALNASYSMSFKYLPGRIGITDMKYLKNFDPGKALADQSQIALNGAEVDKEEFYILVTGDQDISGATLGGQYLPIGGAVTLTPQSSIPGMTAEQRIYKVEGFSSGKQQVRFSFNGSNAYYVATISYATKNFIYIENMYDGQTFEVDSSITTTQTIRIKGQYKDFENVENAEFFVNGKPGKELTPAVDLMAGEKYKDFDFDLAVNINGPLFYGENRIVFTGTSVDGQGNSRTVRKELRIYILDKNLSNITIFRPALADSDKRESFLGLELNDMTVNPKLDRILELSPEFEVKEGSYETSQLKYDLVLQGGGAKIINLNLGSTKFFSSQDIKSAGWDSGDLSNNGQGDTQIVSGTFKDRNNVEYKYNLAVFKDKFVLRIEDVPFDTPGSHVYNVELINATGSRTSQRLEITRVLAAFRILSPKPTVGDQIIVNKNFVRFDIEAEGATRVIVDKEDATKRTDMNNRFFADFVGLKPDKTTKIKIQIIRGTETLNHTVEVYYASAIAIDSQYMTEKPANKYSAFNKALELSFPKGTVLQTANVGTNEVTKFYPDNKYLFGIADPKNGIVEIRNDYGNIINVNKDDRTPNGESSIRLPADLVELFNLPTKTYNFTRVSNVYWISGGIGEKGTKTDPGYKPATNGLPPYSVLPQYSDYGNFKDVAIFEPERKLVPSQRGTLKLAFDKNVVDAAGTTITVFRFNDKAEWENIGGAVNTKDNTITVPFDEFGYYMVMKQSRGYSDITNHPWARNILNALYAKGIMTNVQASAFGADDLTTRGEFATLLVKGLNLPLNYDMNVQTYFDVVPGARTDTWDFKYIETASRAGIISGLGEGYFGVEEPVTRQQAAMMVARALKLKLPANDNKLKDALAKQFLDSGRIDPYARPAVQAVYKAKIMEAQQTMLPGQKKASYNFNPESSMTRAEAGKIAVELLKKSTNIFPKNLS